MHYEIELKRIVFKIHGDFNLEKVIKIGKILAENQHLKKLKFDLSKTSFVNSEAIKLLYFLIKEGKKIDIVNPPIIFRKTLEILDLGSFFLPIIDKPL